METATKHGNILNREPIEKAPLPAVRVAEWFRLFGYQIQEVMAGTLGSSALTKESAPHRNSQKSLTDVTRQPERRWRSSLASDCTQPVLRHTDHPIGRRDLNQLFSSSSQSSIDSRGTSDHLPVRVEHEVRDELFSTQ